MPTPENQRRDDDLASVLRWCRSVLGPCAVVDDASRSHPGGRSAVLRLQTRAGRCCLKTHQQTAYWEAEVHAYERWAPAFGHRAPRLLAVRDAAPLALIVSELPGRSLESGRRSDADELGIWRAAGRALTGLHALGPGALFGACRRDGQPATAVGDEPGPAASAEQRVGRDLDEHVRRGTAAGWLSPAELDVVTAARQRLPCFAGEAPVPCHGDYCPANWLVSDGAWAGVIDFEFSRWDVRVADLARLPDWEWVERPALCAALLEGYGDPGPQVEAQLFVARVQYALTAVVWGNDHDYRGFAREGHRALRYLGEGRRGSGA